MILKLLTGGIDLPKLAQRVKDLDQNYEQTNAALGDHIAKANTRMTTIENVVSSRAFAEDVETLRLKLNRIGWEVERPEEGYCSTIEGKQTLGTEVAQLKASNAILHASVDALTKKVEALTAAKLGEVKARKAPAKK
ncbi:hypothetical protein [Brevundimonas sp. NPDC058933]|uniref:hypothetical protein n=1 Tax=Brevundimonas sp. NPDC058933 TaxID=3346673 RepID=UPI003BEF2C52